MTNHIESAAFSHPRPEVEFAMKQFAQISVRYSASVMMQAAELAKRMQDSQYPIQDVRTDWYIPLILASEVTRQQLLTVTRRAHQRRTRWQKIRRPVRITPEKIAGVISQVGNVADNLKALPPETLNDIIARGQTLRADNHGHHSRKIERQLGAYVQSLVKPESATQDRGRLRWTRALATSLLGLN